MLQNTSNSCQADKNAEASKGVTTRTMRKQSESAPPSQPQPSIVPVDKQSQKSSSKKRSPSVPEVFCKDCHKRLNDLKKDVYKCKSCNDRDLDTLYEPPLSWVVCKTCMKKHQRHKNLVKACVEIDKDGNMKFLDIG